MNTRFEKAGLHSLTQTFLTAILVFTSILLGSPSFGGENLVHVSSSTDAQSKILGAPPPKFINSSIEFNKTASPYFDPSLPLGEYQNKYYQSCFIYIYTKTLGQVEIIRLSTQKVSSCPQEEFRKITAVSVMAQLATISPVKLVSLVGPNIQLMNENNSVIETPSISIGHLNFSAVMSARVGITHIFKNFEFLTNLKTLLRWTNVDVAYNPIAVRQNINYVWYQGSTVYVLTSDTGKKYVMSHYSPADLENFKTEEYLETRLDNLGNFLNLPPGWTFKPVKLKKIMRLTQILYQNYAGEMIVDELDNVYQRIEDVEVLDE